MSTKIRFFLKTKGNIFSQCDGRQEDRKKIHDKIFSNLIKFTWDINGKKKYQICPLFWINRHYRFWTILVEVLLANNVLHDSVMGNEYVLLKFWGFRFASGIHLMEQSTLLFAIYIPASAMRHVIMQLPYKAIYAPVPGVIS